MPNRLHNLEIGELSLCGEGMNKGARVTILKAKKPTLRPEILKGLYGIADQAMKPEAKSFLEILAVTEARQRSWEVNEELYPLFDAVRESIRTIVADDAISLDAKRLAVRNSVDEFAAAVQSRLPAVEAEIEKALKETLDMPTIEELTKSVADLTKRAETAEAAVATVTKRAETAEADLAKAKEVIEKSKTDEVIKIGDAEVRKSVVGEATFAIFKAQQAQITAAEDRATMAELTKAAETAYPSLPGTPALKGSVLKAIGSMPKEAGDALTVMLKAGEAAVKAGFNSVGGGGGGAEPESGEAEFNTLVAKCAETNKISVEKATGKVMETPEGVAAYTRYKAEKHRRAMNAAN